MFDILFGKSFFYLILLHLYLCICVCICVLAKRVKMFPSTALSPLIFCAQKVFLALEILPSLAFSLRPPIQMHLFDFTTWQGTLGGSWVNSYWQNFFSLAIANNLNMSDNVFGFNKIFGKNCCPPERWCFFVAKHWGPSGDNVFDTQSWGDIQRDKRGVKLPLLPQL